MNKKEIKEVVKDFVAGKGANINITFDQLYDTMGGCAYWEKKRYIRKEMLIRHLTWQCYSLDGSVNDEQLREECEIFRTKIIMV